MAVSIGVRLGRELDLPGIVDVRNHLRGFPRTRKLKLWEKNDQWARAVRQLGPRGNAKHKAHATNVEIGSAETAANTIICLIHQASYLLDQQIRQLEQAFLEGGGLRERMTRARLQERTRLSTRPEDVRRNPKQ